MGVITDRGKGGSLFSNDINFATGAVSTVIIGGVPKTGTVIAMGQPHHLLPSHYVSGSNNGSPSGNAGSSSQHTNLNGTELANKSVLNVAGSAGTIVLLRQDEEVVNPQGQAIIVRTPNFGYVKTS